MDEILVTLTRGGFDESHHRGHVAVWHADSGLVAGWGDPEAIILPGRPAKWCKPCHWWKAARRQG